MVSGLEAEPSSLGSGGAESGMVGLFGLALGTCFSSSRSTQRRTYRRRVSVRGEKPHGGPLQGEKPHRGPLQGEKPPRPPVCPKITPGSLGS